MSPQGDHPGARDDHAAPQQNVGATLKAARLRLGEELSGVADVLRIRAQFLQAIEDGHFEALPGLPYAIGFVRTYAEHLGLDGPELVRRFKTEAAGLERKATLSFPSPAPEGRVPGTAALLISLIAVTLVFGGWYFYQNGGERFVLRVPELPERLAAPPVASGPTEPPASTSAAASPADRPPAAPGQTAALAPTPAPVPTPVPAPVPMPGQPSAQAPAPVPAPGTPAPAAAPPANPLAAPVSPPPGRPGAPLGTDAALPPPPGDPTRRLATVAPTPAPPPTPALQPPGAASAAPEVEDSLPPEPTALGQAPGSTAPGGIPPVPQVAAAPTDGRVFGAQNENSRVVIKARGESWVQIRDATNTPLLTRVLRPGDTYRVPNQGGLVMMTGNAGVLDVVVDGNAAPSLGAVGQVRRNIALDAERLRSGTAGQ